MKHHKTKPEKIKSLVLFYMESCLLAPSTITEEPSVADVIVNKFTINLVFDSLVRQNAKHSAFLG